MLEILARFHFNLKKLESIRVMQGKRDREWIVYLNRAIKEITSDMVAFEQGSERHERASLAIIWGEGIPGGGKSKCKGLEAGMYLTCLRNSKEFNRTGAGW